MNINLLRQAVQLVPEVKEHLSPRARFVFGVENPIGYVYGKSSQFEYKTVEYMLARIEGLVRGVYANNVGGDFIDIMANLISGQFSQAYQQAFEDAGYTDFVLPDYLTASLEAMILNQFDYVDQFFRDIVDARIDGTPIDPLLARAQMWAGQWNTAYREAERLILTDGGGNLEWVKGATEKGCSTCANLDGIIMSAKEWDTLGVHPRGYPNNKLECEGGGPANNCDCTLSPTDKRRSPNAYGRVEEIIL